MTAFEKQWACPGALPVYDTGDVAGVVDEDVGGAEVGVP